MRQSALSEYASEPHVLHCPAVTWKLLKAVMPLKVTDWKLANWRGVRHPEIDSSPLAPAFVLRTYDKMRRTSTIGAKMKIDIPAIAASIGTGFSGRLNVIAKVSVGP